MGENGGQPGRATRWINSNKALIEVVFLTAGTISAILLGFAALLVSKRANEIAISQYDIAEAQAVIAERQIEITELSLKPKFRFETKTADYGDTLEIWNDGAPVEFFDAFQMSFIMVNEYPDDPAANTCHYFSTFYYLDSIYTGQRTDLLATFYSTYSAGRSSKPQVEGDSALFLNNVLDIFDEELRKQHVDSYQRPRLANMFLLSYIDQLGQTHETTFHVRTIYGWPAHRPQFSHHVYERELTETQSQRALDTWNGSVAQRLSDVDETDITMAVTMFEQAPASMECYN